VAVDAEVRTGGTLWGDSRKKGAPWIYFSMSGGTEAVAGIHGAQDSWSYRFAVRPGGVSRAQAGRGIRENYLTFSFKNVDGADFMIDRIEVVAAQSNSRRI
jgi:hypothetical protein